MSTSGTLAPEVTLNSALIGMDLTESTAVEIVCRLRLGAISCASPDLNEAVEQVADYIQNTFVEMFNTQEFCPPAEILENESEDE